MVGVVCDTTIFIDHAPARPVGFQKLAYAT
jgi:hypothetical protein